MDDITSLVATPHPDTNLHLHIFDLIENHTYDNQFKNLLVKPQNDNCFLDSFIVIYNNQQSVAITYNNKNASIIDSNNQTVGRFHHIKAPSLITHKLSAAQAILIKIHDFTTFNFDMIFPICSLIHELHTLQYPQNHIMSAITKASRSRPNPIWSTVCDMVFTKIKR